MAKKKTLSHLLSTQPKGDPFGPIGNLPAGQRIKRGRTGAITEDDPRWNPKTMGNKRGRRR
jgi:hypothetical protein